MKLSRHIKVRLVLPLVVMLSIPLTLVLAEAALRLIPYVWPPVYRHLLEDNNRFYVYSIGESTAEGVHFQNHQSPVRLMAWQFNDSLQHKPIEIIPLAQSGSTIRYGYFRFYFETLFRPHTAGLVFIYSGINESVTHQPDSHPSIFRQLIQHSVLLGKLAFILNPYSNTYGTYEHYLSQTIRQAKSWGHQVVLSQIVGNQYDYDPSVPPKDILLTTPNALAKVDSIHRCMENENYTVALGLCRQLSGIMGSPHAYVTFLTARCHFMLQQCDSAKALFDGLDEPYLYNGYAPWKNRLIEQVAQREGAAIARTHTIFKQQSPCAIVGSNLITDAHHPTVEGYNLMSTELARVVSEQSHQPIVRQLPAGSSPFALTAGTAFYRDAYLHITEWYIFHCFSTEIKYWRLKKIKHYTALYKAQQPQTGTLLLWQLIVAVLEQNPASLAQALQQITQQGLETEIVNRIETGFKYSTDAPALTAYLQANRPGHKPSAALIDNICARLQ